MGRLGLVYQSGPLQPWIDAQLWFRWNADLHHLLHLRVVLSAALELFGSPHLDRPTLPALAGDPVLLAEIQAAVEVSNAKLARPEQVKAFRVLPTGWTPESGELTPTLKLRRRVVAERYAETIAALYA